MDVKPVLKRTSGGSVPISPFVNILNIPAVGVPTVNKDNNQHSPNENIKLLELYKGNRNFYWDSIFRVQLDKIV